MARPEDVDISALIRNRHEGGSGVEIDIERAHAPHPKLMFIREGVLMLTCHITRSETTIQRLVDSARRLHARLDCDVVIVLMHSDFEFHESAIFSADDIPRTIFEDFYPDKTFVLSLDLLTRSLRKVKFSMRRFLNSQIGQDSDADETLVHYWARIEQEIQSALGDSSGRWFAFDAPLVDFVRSNEFDDIWAAMSRAVLRFNAGAVASSAGDDYVGLILARTQPRTTDRELTFPDVTTRTKFHTDIELREKMMSEERGPARPLHPDVELDLRGGQERDRYERIEARHVVDEILSRVFITKPNENFVIRDLEEVLPTHHVQVVQDEAGANVTFFMAQNDTRCRIKFQVVMESVDAIQQSDGSLAVEGRPRHLPAADSYVRCDVDSGAVLRRVREIRLNPTNRQAEIVVDRAVAADGDRVSVKRLIIMQSVIVQITSGCRPADRNARALALFMHLRNAVADRMQLTTVTSDVAVSKSGRSTISDIQTAVRARLRQDINARLLDTLQNDLARVGFYREFGFRYFDATRNDQRFLPATTFVINVLFLLFVLNTYSWKIDIYRPPNAPDDSSSLEQFLSDCRAFQRLLLLPPLPHEPRRRTLGHAHAHHQP